MKFTFKFMEDIQECNRANIALPRAMHPMLDSKFFLRSTEGREGGHQHVVSVASSGFGYLAEIEEGAKVVEAFEQASHFAFRNTMTILVDVRWIEESGPLTEEAAHDLTLFLAHYIAGVYGTDSSIGLRLNKTAEGYLSDNGVDSVAFVCHAFLPTPEEEWERLLVVKEMEVQWARMYLANRKAQADVAAAGILNKFTGKLH